MLYENMHTGEIVYEEDAEEYAKEKLGITMQPVRRWWNIYSRTIRGNRNNDRMVFLWRLD